MANLRRHFNFSGKASMQGPEIAYMAQSETNNPFDKCGLMKDICNCLELCCTYIQALNSLCSAGSSLAKSLFHAVQDVPAYHNISQQFLAIWEEVSKATAGASASVKTETLMMLQEVLNTLDVGNNEVDMDDTITESFQVIGTCLCSFIELQSQFSWSTWKSLSKLSKNFSSDTFRRSIQWKSSDRPFKISVNSDLNSTIKKPFAQLFCKIGIAKVNESGESSQSQFFTSPSIQRDIAAYSHLSSQTSSDNNTSDSSIWSHSTAFWSSSDTTQSDPSTTAQCAAQGSNPADVSHSDLDEVINLLSCAPAQQLANDAINSQESNYFPPTSSREQFYQRWPKGSTPPISRHPSPNKSWVKDSRDIMFGYDSWIWRADYMNCSGLPRDESKVMWENSELQKWNIGMCETGSSSDDASSIHGQDSESVPSGINSLLNQQAMYPTRHGQKSGESLPGGLENSSSMKDENLWDLRSSKMSTWPLKLSAHRTNSESELHEAQLQTTYSQLHFAFS